MNRNEMTPTQYLVQKILNKQPIEPMDGGPVRPPVFPDCCSTPRSASAVFPSQLPQSFSGINRTSLCQDHGRHYPAAAEHAASGSR